MRRRDFITMLGAAAPWPFAARAQQGERMRRIGVLTPFAEGDQEAKAWLTAFQEVLQQLGWAQGRNVSIDYRWAGDRLQINAAELVAYCREEVPKLLNKLKFDRPDPRTEQFPSAFLPDLERLLPVARRAPAPEKQ